jgi:hypothetical protein
MAYILLQKNSPNIVQCSGDSALQNTQKLHFTIFIRLAQKNACDDDELKRVESR